MNVRFFFYLIGVVFWGLANSGLAQPVQVTVRLDRAELGVCETTTLRVFAQVIPELRSTTDRIASWYLDVSNSSPAIAFANYNAMTKSASDNDPELSSSGTTVGSSRRGVYDTLFHRPSAGVPVAVELIAIPITAWAPGVTRFEVAHGSGVPSLDEDFIVVPLEGGELLTGGNYTDAFAELTVTDQAVTRQKQIHIAHDSPAPGLHRVTATFNPVPGCDCFVEFRDNLETNSAWETFPNGPHNSGSFEDTTTLIQRFYRLRATPNLNPAN